MLLLMQVFELFLFTFVESLVPFALQFSLEKLLQPHGRPRSTPALQEVYVVFVDVKELYELVAIKFVDIGDNISAHNDEEGLVIEAAVAIG
jgi:hypothetical protein